MLTMKMDLNKHRTLSKSYRMLWRFLIYGVILFALLYLINRQQKETPNEQLKQEFEITTEEIDTPDNE